MTILVLTSELTTTNGWGRYSMDLVESLRSSRVDSTVLIARGGEVASGYTAVPILPSVLPQAPLAFFAWLSALTLLPYAYKADVIHAYVETYAPIARALSMLTGKPYFVTAHGTYGVLGYSLPFPANLLHADAFKHASRVIAVSEYTKKRLEAFGLKNVEAIHNGIRFDAYAPERVRPFLEREPLALSVGAFKRRKGHHVAVEAFATLAKEDSSARLIIAGDQGDRAYVERVRLIAESFGVLPRIEFLGLVTPEELRVLYGRARAFVMTSLSEGAHFEGFGLVYLEANANGVPVVGATGSGVENAILDGETGYLVPQHDVEATAGALKKLLFDEAEWTRLSKRAQAFAREHDWSVIAPRYAKLYRLP